MLRYLLLSAILAIGISSSAVAQNMCSHREDVIAQLAESYSEVPVGGGIATNGGYLELLSSETGSWTVILTFPNGLSCVVATGSDWTGIDRIALGPAA